MPATHAIPGRASVTVNNMTWTQNLFGESDEILTLARYDQIKPGMTAEEVRKRLGPPRTVAREVLYGRYLEQWTYDAPAVRIEFDWRKGEPKQIQTIRILGLP